MQSRIATESQRQAMDWSLVLVSQGIECIIDESEGTHWSLIVNPSEYASSLAILEKYRHENQRWPWQQKVFHEQISFDWGSVAWVLLMCLFFWFSERIANFRGAGLMDSKLISRGEWWRVFTAIDLHADPGHLAGNVGIGFVLLGLTMGRYGTGIGLFAAMVAGVCGNVASWIIYHDGHQSLGASGMVMGCLGLLAAQSVSLVRRDKSSWKYVTAGLAGGLMLFILTGLAPGTDVVAHFGGFVAGMVLGTALCFAPGLRHSAPTNLCAGAIFSALVVIPWSLAARAGK